MLYLLDEKRPPLRGYLMDGDFFIGAALSSTLAKLALRYLTLVHDPKKQNVSILALIFMI